MAHLKEETAASHALAHRREGSARAITLLCREYGGFAAAYNALQERGIALPDREAAAPELDAYGIELVLRNDPLVPEYPPGVEPFSFRFLERNRIVSGLARGVIIIEAPEKSGALVTARLALEQNRDVFVVPGKPNEPQYRGSHALLRDGARIVARPEEVLEDLGLAPGTADRADAALDGTEADVLALLKENGPLSIDKLVERSNLGPHEITQALALLALKGLVIESGANYYAEIGRASCR